MKRLPTGIDDFRKIREDGYYYVDKTPLIKSVIQKGTEVTLFTRPRRFGKSLNISMLRNFFETDCDPSLFFCFSISEDRIFCERYMGKFPNTVSLFTRSRAGFSQSNNPFR